MSSRSFARMLTCAALAVIVVPASARATTRFYVPPPHKEAIAQGLQLLRQHRVRDALLIAALETKPKAVWVTKGTPADARSAVRDAVRGAARQRDRRQPCDRHPRARRPGAAAVQLRRGLSVHRRTALRGTQLRRRPPRPG